MTEAAKINFNNVPYEIVEFITNREISNEYSDNRFGVTELLGCIRKTWIKRMDAKEGRVPDYDLNTLWYFVRGELFDAAICSLFRLNQVRVTHRVPGTDIVIVGRIDFIKDDVVYDLKTVADGIVYFMKEDDPPKSHHEKQVLFYAYCNGNPNAAVVYLTMKHPPFVKWARMEKMHEVIKEIEEKAVKLHEALITSTPPPVEKSWECKWSTGKCVYYERCYGDDVDG